MDLEYKDCICTDDEGNVFISFENRPEAVLSVDPLLTHCLAVVRVGEEYLLGWNKYRSRYEIFGGCKEQGESARECIVRELSEELGVDTSSVKYFGAMRFLMKPDYFSSDERIELGGLYGVALPETSSDELYRQVRDKEEITKLAFYSQVKDKEPIAIIDKKLLEYY